MPKGIRTGSTHHVERRLERAVIMVVMVPVGLVVALTDESAHPRHNRGGDNSLCSNRSALHLPNANYGGGWQQKHNTSRRYVPPARALAPAGFCPLDTLCFELRNQHSIRPSPNCEFCMGRATGRNSPAI
jgi:hypothetical protein